MTADSNSFVYKSQTNTTNLLTYNASDIESNAVQVRTSQSWASTVVALEFDNPLLAQVLGYVYTVNVVHFEEEVGRR
jgi:hypothetical protein